MYKVLMAQMMLSPQHLLLLRPPNLLTTLKNLDSHQHRDSRYPVQSCRNILDQESPATLGQANHTVLVMLDTESPITVRSAAQEITEDLVVPIQE